MEDSIWRIIILIIQGMLVFFIGAIPKQKGGLYNGLRAGILAYYTIFPLLINIIYVFSSESTRDQIYANRSSSVVLGADPIKMLIVLILVSLFTFLLAIAYSSKKSIRISIGAAHREYGKSLTLERGLKNNFISKLGIAGDVFLVVGGFCTLYYTLSFGSISRALALAGWIRGFVSATNYISYFASLMIIPGGFVVLAPFCYLLSSDYSKSIGRRIKFIISFLLAFLFLFIRAGRAPLLIYILAFCMPIAIRIFKHPWRLLCICAVIGMPILEYMDYLFGSGDFVLEYNISGTLAQFLYPYRTVLDCFDIVESLGIRWGKDFVTTFIGLFPGVNYDTTWEVISKYYGGSDWKTTGSTPSDLLTFCILEYHVLGLFLGAVLGRISKHVDQACKAYLQNSMKLSNYGVLTVCSYITLIGFWFVSTADFDSIVRYMYYMGMCVVVIITTKRRCFKNGE